MSGHPDDRWNAVLTWLDEPLRGATSGLLEGRTLLVKDLIDTAGVRTTYGSRIYADHVPARSATVVDRVLAAGAFVLGKANLVEFAWGVLGTNPWYGTVRNPARPGATTGGSSPSPTPDESPAPGPPGPTRSRPTVRGSWCAPRGCAGGC